jgi:hypothetical protein
VVRVVGRPLEDGPDGDVIRGLAHRFSVHFDVLGLNDHVVAVSAGRSKPSWFSFRVRLPTSQQTLLLFRTLG